MSYILEALKKAEAQRGQGQVPGIHDQHMAPEFSGGAVREGQSLLIWIIMAMGLVMIGLLVWALWGPEGGGNTPAQAAIALPAVPAPARATPPALAVPPAQATPPAATATQAPQEQASPPAPVVPVLVPSRNERKAHADSSEVTQHTGNPSATKPAQEDPPELPEAMKAQLPRLAFGGAMHSDNPASRMLIVNGQLLHEGDAISPDLTLERIQLKQATFRYKGYRYTAQY